MGTEANLKRLCELEPGPMCDCFVLLAAKERRTTRDGKPFYRVSFRDSVRTVTTMIWSDVTWFQSCEHDWTVGQFYKLRCRYSETQYGPQIEIDRIREVEQDDAADGFDSADFFQSTRFDVEKMFRELRDLADNNMDDNPLKRLVLELLDENSEDIKQFPAASRNHHAFRGGFLEHVLSVSRTAAFLADKYREYYPHMQPPLSKSLVVAGAILHDIGKLTELRCRTDGADYTASGRLIGHILIGRDVVREKATTIPEMDAELLLRLEHIIVAHQNLPEWGSPVSPHTPEALLVHYADDIDAKFHMMAVALEEPATDDAEFTSRQNALRRPIFRGFGPQDS